VAELELPVHAASGEQGDVPALQLGIELDPSRRFEHGENPGAQRLEQRDRLEVELGEVDDRRLRRTHRERDRALQALVQGRVVRRHVAHELGWNGVQEEGARELGATAEVDHLAQVVADRTGSPGAHAHVAVDLVEEQNDARQPKSNEHLAQAAEHGERRRARHRLEDPVLPDQPAGDRLPAQPRTHRRRGLLVVLDLGAQVGDDRLAERVALAGHATHRSAHELSGHVGPAVVDDVVGEVLQEHRQTGGGGELTLGWPGAHPSRHCLVDAQGVVVRAFVGRQLHQRGGEAVRPGQLPDAVQEVRLAAAEVTLGVLEARSRSALEDPADVLGLEDAQIGLVADVDVLDTELRRLSSLGQPLHDVVSQLSVEGSCLLQGHGVLPPISTARSGARGSTDPAHRVPG